MKTNAVQQEILLNKKATFSHRVLFEVDTPENKTPQSHDEQLEAACWNGWVDAMLPEVLSTDAAGKPLYLWETMQSNTFVTMEWCAYPQKIEVQYSINPYAALATACYT